VYFARSLKRRADIRIKVELSASRAGGWIRCITCGTAPIGWSGKSSTCSGSHSAGTPTCGASSCGRPTPRVTVAEELPLRGAFLPRRAGTAGAQHQSGRNYSLEELSIAEAAGDLPDDMRDRLRAVSGRHSGTAQ